MEDIVSVFCCLADNLLAARQKGYDEHLDLEPGPMGTHQPNPLGRNRAAILYQHLETNACFGHNWLGISGAKNFHIANVAHLKVVHPESDKTVNVKVIYGKQHNIFLKNVFYHKNSHSGCSEVAVLNALHYYLGFKARGYCVNFREGNSNLYILTERIPCRHCALMLNDFAIQYSDTVLHIGYMYDILDKNVERDVEVFMCEIDKSHHIYKIEAISNKDKGYIHVGKLPQWAPKGVAEFSSPEMIQNDDARYRLHIIEEQRPDSSPIKLMVANRTRASGQPSHHFGAKILSSEKNISK